MSGYDARCRLPKQQATASPGGQPARSGKEIHIVSVGPATRWTAAVILIAAVACEPAESTEGLPVGDRDRGAALFSQSINGAPACSECHTLDGATLVGPSLLDYGQRATTRETGTDPLAYTHASIVRPGEHVVEGYNNAMYGQYQQHLSAQQIADLIAFLLAQ